MVNGKTAPASRPSWTPTYVIDRSLCARCGNEGTLKHEGVLDGCPDCPTGREVRKQLAELNNRQEADQ